jgi:acid phosphatase
LQGLQRDRFGLLSCWRHANDRARVDRTVTGSYDRRAGAQRAAVMTTRTIRRLSVACALAMVTMFTSSAAVSSTAIPSFDHIFVIVMENKSFNDLIGNSSAPYLNSLAQSNGLAANYFALTHPSLPNYLMMTAGDNYGDTTDCDACWLSAPNIAVDRVETSGRTWKAYYESMTSNCQTSDSSLYNHLVNPWVYYNDIRTNPTECNRVVPYANLSTDLAAAATTPNFAWIGPNMCDNMHDCSIATGDTWLANNVPTILNSPAFTTQRSLLVITWDEDNYDMNNQVPAILIGSGVTPGYRSTIASNHYSLLKTIETAWAFAPLTANDTNAQAMTDFFTSPPALPGAPTRITAISAKKNATVSWTPPSNIGGCPLTNYKVIATPGGRTLTVAANTTTATFTNLAMKTTYTFTAAAANCAGFGSASVPSNPVTITPK